MKNTLYKIGIICITVILLGAIAKAFHLPGAGISIVLGLGSMSLIFLPIAYINALKSTHDKFLHLVFHTAFISFFIDFIGMIFKIMQWPGAAKLMIIGIPLPFILFLPTYIIYHNKRQLKSDGNFFSILLFMLYLGIFSSLLAVNFSFTYLHSLAEVANTTTKSHATIKQYSSKQALALIDQIEKTKTNIATNIFEGNNNIMNSSISYNYKNIIAKDKRVSQDNLCNSGINEFYSALNDYKNSLDSISTIQKRLISEIEIYQTTNGQNSTCDKLEKLPLIGVLNILNDWQNKIILLEYLKQNTPNNKEMNVINPS